MSDQGVRNSLDKAASPVRAERTGPMPPFAFGSCPKNPLSSGFTFPKMRIDKLDQLLRGKRLSQ